MKIRLGNDVKLQWEIFKGDQPYNIKENAIIKLIDPHKKQVKVEYTINQNNITVFFRGKDQKTYGKYTLILIENDGLNDMMTVDYKDVFELTHWSEI